jgi:hypothetical protein
MGKPNNLIVLGARKPKGLNSWFCYKIGKPNNLNGFGS